MYFGLASYPCLNNRGNVQFFCCFSSFVSMLFVLMDLFLAERKYNSVSLLDFCSRFRLTLSFSMDTIFPNFIYLFWLCYFVLTLGELRSEFGEESKFHFITVILINNYQEMKKPLDVIREKWWWLELQYLKQVIGMVYTLQFKILRSPLEII